MGKIVSRTHQYAKNETNEQRYLQTFRIVLDSKHIYQSIIGIRIVSEQRFFCVGVGNCVSLLTKR